MAPHASLRWSEANPPYAVPSVCLRGAGQPAESAGVGDGGAPPCAAAGALRAELARKPLDGAAGHSDALAVERRPDLAGARRRLGVLFPGDGGEGNLARGKGDLSATVGQG